MQTYQGIQIPDTARDWELYSTEPGSGKAAREMTAALKRSLNAFVTMIGDMTDGDTVAKVLGKAADIPDGINAAMTKYGDLGAGDTEPRFHRDQAMIDFAKKRLFGTTAGYHPELGDCL